MADGDTRLVVMEDVEGAQTWTARSNFNFDTEQDFLGTVSKRRQSSLKPRHFNEIRGRKAGLVNTHTSKRLTGQLKTGNRVFLRGIESTCNPMRRRRKENKNLQTALQRCESGLQVGPALATTSNPLAL